jgi:hypothetical protein
MRERNERWRERKKEMEDGEMDGNKELKKL